jgi:hypothetical protein
MSRRRKIIGPGVIARQTVKKYLGKENSLLIPAMSPMPPPPPMRAFPGRLNSTAKRRYRCFSRVGTILEGAF